MKILLSLYEEDHDTGNHSLVFSKWISTDWNITQIDDYLELHEGFHSELTIGQNLSFWDIFCFFSNIQELVARIEKIPATMQEDTNPITPTFLRVSEYNPGNTDNAEYPDLHSVFLYSVSRYECGASGYEAVVYWMSTHPLEMMFIGGIVYDGCKSLLRKALRAVNVRFPGTSQRPMALRVKRLYKNFERITHIKTSECQIVKLKRMKTGVFSLIIRTSTNEKYKVQCLANGKIKLVEIVVK